MSKIQNAARSMEKIDELARQNTPLNRVHPLPKLLITLLYLVLVVSFPSRRLTGILGMALYPFVLFEVSQLSFKAALYRLRIVLPIVCAVGILNPFFDTEPVLTVFGITITGGVLTMFSLMAKGVLTVLSSYLLIATTPVESICSALRTLHVPGILVTEFLLICRYITVLLQEADRITQAYSLRAPGQKGIAISAWGSLIGQLLLRSMDRASVLYQSMCLRGYHVNIPPSVVRTMQAGDYYYLAGFAVALIAMRLYPVPELVGYLFVHH